MSRESPTFASPSSKEFCSAATFPCTEEAALKYARELCEAFEKRKDCLKNLSRYSVKVYRFHGTDLKFRSDIFDSKREYLCVL